MDKKLLLSLGAAFITGVAASAADSFECGQWTVSIDPETKAMDITHGEITLLKQGYAQYKNAEGATIKSTSAASVSVSAGEAVSDLFGQGTKYTVSYDMADGADIEQAFYAYDSHPEYFLTEVTIKSETETKTNYISPLTTETASSVLPEDGTNRWLSVPFSNDNFTRYKTPEVNGNLSSYYVAAIYDGVSRNGYVIGAVDFDTWKFVVRAEGARGYGLRSLETACGCVTPDDLRANVAMQHGSIVGKELKSSRILVGYFDDWRRGMETYADAVATVTPERKNITGKSFFGWNSWAVLQTDVNYQGVLDVIDFFKNEATEYRDNEDAVYVVLDSWWNDNIKPGELKDITRQAVRSGFKSGIYNTPFSDWNGYDGISYDDPAWGSGKVNGSDYTYKDIILTYNGRPIRLDNGWALDPTHPGTKALAKYNIDQFKSWGYKYVKLDFLCNGIVEADKWYNPDVHTGMQAYNEGMKFIADYCGDDVFIDYSIAPTLPAQYANARRISCDAWGDISNSEMVLNCMAYGWWLDRLYNFNDGDHAVFENYSEGENRVRMTSEIMNSYVLLGDNFSLSGRKPGTQAIRDQALKVINNPEINEIARTCGGTFWPVYGYSSQTGAGEKYMMFDAGTVLYLAAINYGGSEISGAIPMADLGIESTGDVLAIKELWGGESYELNSEGELEFTVPAKDVLMFKFDKVAGIGEIVTTGEGDGGLQVGKQGDIIYMSAARGLQSAAIYSLDGSMVQACSYDGEAAAELGLGGMARGVYVVRVIDAAGNVRSVKFIK